MHGNAGNKLEGASMYDDICSRGYNLLAYDASGCGNSEGEYLTLGWRESNDIALIVDHLVNDHGQTEIALWGRSMGAATALTYLG